MDVRHLDTEITYEFFKNLRDDIKHDDIVFESEEHCLSFKTLFSLVDAFCIYLKSHGVKPGDRVVLALENDLHTVVIFVASMWFGITITLIDPLAPKSETKKILDLFDPSCLILAPKLDNSLGFLTNDEYLDKTKLIIESSLFEQFSNDAKQFKNYDAPRRSFKDPMMIVFTSGTTGQPKGVVLSYKAVLKQSYNMAVGIDFNRNSRILNLFRFYQIGGIVNGILLALLHGGTLYRPYENFNFSMSKALLDVLKKKPVSHFIFVPNLLSCLFRHKVEFKKAFSIPSFRFFVTTAAPISDDLWLQVETLTEKLVINTFGSSEINNVTFTERTHTKDRIGTIGRLFDTECKIVDSEGDSVPRGETGDLLLRGDTSMSEYLKSPELTKQIILDGWVKTGDLAYEHNENIIYVGRSYERIISGGHTIYPNEITNLLLSHSDIADAYTFGKPHSEWGELVACCIVPRIPDLTRITIVGFLRERLSTYKMPRKIVMVESIPITKRGKVDLQEIQKLVS